MISMTNVLIFFSLHVNATKALQPDVENRGYSRRKDLTLMSVRTGC